MNYTKPAAEVLGTAMALIGHSTVKGQFALLDVNGSGAYNAVPAYDLDD
jgi:hypothetical protein